VRVHPETGRRSLFVNRNFTSHIPQLHPGEGESLLNYLYDWSERPAFQCRYPWSNGDIGIWDNRCTQHNVAGDFKPPRIIHRLTIVGDKPAGVTDSPWEHYDAPYRTIRTFFDRDLALGRADRSGQKGN
jgi:taurine dioxygenase